MITAGVKGDPDAFPNFHRPYYYDYIFKIIPESRSTSTMNQPFVELF